MTTKVYHYEPTSDELDAVAHLRATHPRMRRVFSTAVEHTGGQQTTYRCLCGARHTVATEYRQAKHLCEWRQEHSGCARRILDGKTKIVL